MAKKTKLCDRVLNQETRDYLAETFPITILVEDGCTFFKGNSTETLLRFVADAFEAGLSLDTPEEDVVTSITEHPDFEKHNQTLKNFATCPLGYLSFRCGSKELLVHPDLLEAFKFFTEHSDGIGDVFEPPKLASLEDLGEWLSSLPEYITEEYGLDPEFL